MLVDKYFSFLINVHSQLIFIYCYIGNVRKSLFALLLGTYPKIEAILNQQNNWILMPLFFLFCQEHYSRPEEKLWNSEISNRKFDSLSSTCGSCGWAWGLNWFDTSGRQIHLPGGIRNCFCFMILSIILSFCTQNVRVIFIGYNYKE
jgi:hypothetical protein